MALRLVGAGLGRTGTHSLKLALEQLLGAPCYHMVEVFGKPDHVAEWRRGVEGGTPDWDLIFDGYAAAVDWPTAAFYRPLMERYPEALVLLSTRRDAAEWHKSAQATIFSVMDKVADAPPDLEAMAIGMLTNTFTPEWRDADAAMAAYDRHNATVRSVVPAERLVEWQPGDGWAPLCRALGVPEPADPFPHVNTTADFRAMTGLD
jgi:sulfotransferase family protein